MFTSINIALNPELKPTLFYVKVTMYCHRVFRNYVLLSSFERFELDIYTETFHISPRLPKTSRNRGTRAHLKPLLPARKIR